MDTGYLFQIQILLVSLNDTQPKSLGTIFLFKLCISCMYVVMWMFALSSAYMYENVYTYTYTYVDVRMEPCVLFLCMFSETGYNTWEQGSLIRLD